MFAILKDKNIFKIWLSRVTSTCGDVLFDFFLTWKVYERSQDIKDIAILLGGSYLLKAFFALIAGNISDRFPRRKLLIFSDLSCAVIASLFILLYNSGVNSILMYLLLILIKDFLVVLFGNSFTSVLVDLIPREELIKVQALISTSLRIMALIGSAAAGVLVSVMSVELAISIDALSFIISALLFYSVKNLPQQTSTTSVPTATAEAAPLSWKQINANFIKIKFNDTVLFIKQHILSSPILLVFLPMIFVLNLVYGYVPLVLPYLLSNTHHFGAVYLGILKSSVVVGEIIGLFLVGRYGNHVSKCFVIGLLGTAVSILFLNIKIYPEAIILAAYFLYGLFDSLTGPLFSYVISSINTSVRGRVMGLLDLVVLSSVPLGMYLGQWLCKVNLQLAIVFFGIIPLLAAFVAYRSKDIRKAKMTPK